MTLTIEIQSELSKFTLLELINELEINPSKINRLMFRREYEERRKLAQGGKGSDSKYTDILKDLSNKYNISYSLGVRWIYSKKYTKK